MLKIENSLCKIRYNWKKKVKNMTKINESDKILTKNIVVSG